MNLARHLAVAAAAGWASALLLADTTVDGRLKLAVKPMAPPVAQPFSLHDVRLLDGPFKTAQDIGVNYLLSLEPDRFLANFRVESGLPPKAEHYPGWERRGVSGHSLGHYLSACSLAYGATGDPRLLERVHYIVRELAECQQANTNGYLAAIPEGRRVYAEVAAGNIRSSGFDLNGCWVPNYTMHKLFAGLRDAYRIAGDTQALAVARALADWFNVTLAGLNDEQMQRILAAEHGGLNETFADLYADTGDPRYLALSRRFHHRAILDPLARGEDILPGKHANTQIPKLIGLATRYELTADPADRAAAAFFWDRVVNHHSYITGGHCDHEHFGPPDRLNDRLSPETTETCNVYNMLKLTRHVFGWDPQPAVADFYERALLNHILATQHPDGRVIYNLSLQPGHHKEYQALFDGFTCCMGTGMENHVRYGEGIFFHSSDALWVNLWIASELTWQARGLKVRLDTKWPDADTAVLTFACAEPQEFVLRLRHPHWGLQGMTATVHPVQGGAGDAAAPALVTVRRSPAETSGYLELRRRWTNGDRVEIQIPMSLRTESMPDNPRRLGVFYGPTLLAADLGPVENPAANRPGFVPVLITGDRPVGDWVRPVSLATGTFRTEGMSRPRPIEWVPFYRLHDRRYAVYLDVFSESEWAQREAEIRNDQEREARLAARTLDVLRVGEMQPERDHNLHGENTSAGEALGRKWRHATDGGWFAFDMRVVGGQPAELVCTYWGGDGGGHREFDIRVGDILLATQRLEQNQPGRFFDVTYPIPAELTAGRDTVTVRFQAKPGKWAGGLFGARMLRRDE